MYIYLPIITKKKNKQEESTLKKKEVGYLQGMGMRMEEIWKGVIFEYTSRIVDFWKQIDLLHI